MIEHLPQELRDRFTEMREMDLQVHSKRLYINIAIDYNLILIFRFYLSIHLFH